MKQYCLSINGSVWGLTFCFLNIDILLKTVDYFQITEFLMIFFFSFLKIVFKFFFQNIQMERPHQLSKPCFVKDMTSKLKSCIAWGTLRKNINIYTKSLYKYHKLWSMSHSIYVNKPEQAKSSPKHDS